MEVPAGRYQPSPRGFPQQLPALEYGPDDPVRKMPQGGVIHFAKFPLDRERKSEGSKSLVIPVSWMKPPREVNSLVKRKDH